MRAAAISVAAAVLLWTIQANAETIRVEIEGLAFSPAKVTAHIGDTIEWANVDFLDHTATARNHDWDVQLPVNSTKRVVLKKAGAIEYFCRFHPNMTGTVTVEKARR
jgi:plastocyanin